LSTFAEPFPESSASPRWLHRLALLTVCMVLLALTSGAVVTTFRVGMADPIWPTYPWHLALISWREPSPGFIVEHTHRLFDYVLGLCCIVLAISMWRCHARRPLGWLGIVALAGVIVQGLLGGFRVLLNALVGTDLALIHGLFAQLVFGVLVSLALLTSPSWNAAQIHGSTPAADRIWRLSVLTVAIVFLQLIFGAILRHTRSPIGQTGHLLVAFAVVAIVTWLAQVVFGQHEGDKPLAVFVGVLAGLVALQVLLGVEALRIRFAVPGLPDLQITSIPQAIVRTAHFVLGSLIFGTAVTVLLWSRRGLGVAVRFPVATTGRLEGAA